MSQAAATVPVETHMPMRFHDNRLGTTVAKILPGAFFATAEDIVLMTVLGSCVAVCLYDPQARIGGMNHFMLPEDRSVGSVSASGRYGSHAMELLINDMLKAGAERARLTAKVFGGAAVLASLAGSRVGERNAEFVRAYLAAERVPVLAADLEGLQPRKVLLYAAQGRVRVRHLAAVEAGSVAVQEKTYRARLSTEPVAGDVALF